MQKTDAPLRRTKAEPMLTSNQRTVITIGNFDGVHLGHRRLVDAAVLGAVSVGCDAVAVTFEPHPVSYFKGSAADSFRLQTPDGRDATLRSLGLARVDRITFDAALTAMTPDAFFELLLSRHPGLIEVHVGEDFRFGAGRAGDTATLQALGLARGIGVQVHTAVTHLGEPVSSSRARAALRAADLPLVSSLLGRPYAVDGEIASGHGRGRVLGVPTVNLYPEGQLLPPHGVYVATILSGAQAIPAVANLGTRPTFADDPRISLEAHALDDFESLEREVRVILHQFVRAERRFPDTAALRAQIDEDIATANGWHEAQRPL